MAEPEPEGWRVPQRPAVVAAVLTPLLLAAAVWGTGRLYERTLRPAHRRPVTTFPAPGIETFIHDGQGDPQRRPPPRRADPALAAAKRSVVAGGWGTVR